MVDARKFLTELEISYVWRDAKINLREYNPFMKRIFFCENESVLLGIILLEYTEFFHCQRAGPTIHQDKWPLDGATTPTYPSN